MLKNSWSMSRVVVIVPQILSANPAWNYKYREIPFFIISLWWYVIVSSFHPSLAQHFHISIYECGLRWVLYSIQSDVNLFCHRYSSDVQLCIISQIEIFLHYLWFHIQRFSILRPSAASWSWIETSAVWNFLRNGIHNHRQTLQVSGRPWCWAPAEIHTPHWRPLKAEHSEFLHNSFTLNTETSHITFRTRKFTIFTIN